MALTRNTANLERERPDYRSIPMRVVGGNSSLDEAQVVFLGTRNHYDHGFQERIASTLSILPQEGDFVLTEGEPARSLNSSWIPEMKQVDTSKVTLRGWEDAPLYEKAKGIITDLREAIHLHNFLSGTTWGDMLRPFISELQQRISKGMEQIDSVVLHERTNAMKASVMNILGNNLRQGGRIFTYAGAAHLTSTELSGMNGVRYAVLEV